MAESIVIVEYDPDWALAYETERDRILDAIGNQLTAVEHVGSTAVPGLGAKPIIDIMVAVADIDDYVHAIAPLEGLGYEYVSEYEEFIPERRYFRKGAEPSSHHLHMVQRTTSFWHDHLLFRDYLRTHDETARDYEELKKALAAKLGDDRLAFTEAKTAFIESVLAQARV